MKTTLHYQLARYEAKDQPGRYTSNQNFDKTDEILGQKPDVVWGSYYGDSNYPRIITLDFQPRALLLFTSNGATNSNGTEGGLLLPGMPLRAGDNIYVSLTEFGFLIHQPSSVDYFGSNLRGITYYYLALR